MLSSQYEGRLKVRAVDIRRQESRTVSLATKGNPDPVPKVRKRNHKEPDLENPHSSNSKFQDRRDNAALAFAILHSLRV